MGTFALYGLILYGSEYYFSELLCSHNVGMGTFVPHGLILYEYTIVFSLCLLFHIHSMNMKLLPHELILYVFEDCLYLLYCIYNVDIDLLNPHGLTQYQR